MYREREREREGLRDKERSIILEETIAKYILTIMLK